MQLTQVIRAKMAFDVPRACIETMIVAIVLTATEVGGVGTKGILKVYKCAAGLEREGSGYY